MAFGSTDNNNDLKESEVVTLAPQADLQQSMVLFIKACSLRDSGKISAAAAIFQQSIRACPMNGLPYYDLIAMLLRIRDVKNALKVLEAVPPALLRQSTQLKYMHALILLEAGDIQGGAAILVSFIGNKDINQGELFNNLGSCYNRLEQYDEAIEWYERAYKAKHSTPEHYLNWAGVYQKKEETKIAGRLYDEAVSRFPENQELRYEQAIFLLKSESYSEGFKQYSCRWQSLTFNERPTHVLLPKWNGQFVDSLLVVGEQGLGDLIVYASYIPVLSGRVGRIGLVFDPRLSGLMQRSFSSVVNESIENGVVVSGRHYDAYIYAGDIGAFLTESHGWRNSFLKPDEDKVVSFRERYRSLFPGKKLVGISWKSKRSVYGESKSVDIHDWGPVFNVSDCQFINLQYGDVATDISVAEQKFGVKIYVDSAVDTFNDMDGLAAQMSALDQVITTSNTTAHIAAAVNAPTWVILPFGAALIWYWGFREEKTLWYPNVRLFRAKNVRDWAPVMQSVSCELKGN